MTYFIDITDFQRKADLSQNLNTNKLKASIGITQEKFVIQILCQDLYDYMIINFDSLSGDYATLLTYVQDFLIYKSYARYLVGSNVIMTPSGARTQNDSTSEIASSQQMLSLQRQAEQDADFYQDKLINYLIENEDTFTLWRDSICNCGDKRRPLNLSRFSKVGNQNSEEIIKWT